MKFPFFRSPSWVGLDVQPDSVRLIQLRKIKKGFLIERLGFQPLPTGVFVEGKIKVWDRLCSVLSEWVHTWDIKNQATAITLSAQLVRMQHIQLPSGMPSKDIEAEIHAQIARDFPGMTEALCLDFTELRHEQTGYSDIFFVVTRQEYLSRYVSCVNAAGLKVKMVDVDIYTLKRAVNLALPFQILASQAAVLLYLTNRLVTLIIFNEREILLHQQWDMVDISDFHVQFKTRMQIFFATLGNISLHRLIVCASTSDLTWLTQALPLLWEGEIFYPDLFRHISCAPTVNETFLTEHANDFLIACGSAMRGVPR